MSVIEKLAAEGHITGEQVDRIGRTAADFRKLAATDPEFAADLQKAAGMLGATKDLMTAMLPSYAVNMAVVGTTAGVATASNKVYNSVMKARNYKAMLTHNQDLGEHDAKQVQMAFNTLQRFNPDYAEDPMVAGEFVRRNVESARLPLQEISGIIQARKQLVDTRQSQQRGMGVPDLNTALQMANTSASIQQNARKSQMGEMHGQQQAEYAQQRHDQELRNMRAQERVIASEGKANVMRTGEQAKWYSRLSPQDLPSNQ